eukprot:m.650467 g.650467  ORF g.650467 m.650467 type:complete len:217 (-) comp22672_c0_seq5:1384-2034(-)
MSATATQRLKKELKQLITDPEEHLRAMPLPNNLLEWHFVLLPPKECVYEGGEYHGKIVLPKDYPFKPPAVMMITPNGRFSTNTRLCLSMSDFHPETWCASWQVRTVILGLLSFMLEDDITAGSISTSEEERKKLARLSRAFNSKNKIFRELFPEYCDPLKLQDGNIGKHATLKELSAQQYNGQNVKVTGWDNDAGRYIVELPAGNTIRVKEANVEF